MNHYVVECVINGRPTGAAEHSCYARAEKVALRTYARGWYDVVRIIDSRGAVCFALGVASRVGGKFLGGGR